MGMYGSYFLKSIQEHLTCQNSANSPPDVYLQEYGYLFLASDEGVETIRENHRTQMLIQI